ncbi:hypothetical protein J8273_1379 [Carpediemonas membranifera]|uniref:Uncharacterized protein n=1 Tax=Carpediemonas membranifera TaxID=201153 RepID=A0A8J6E4C4_9EUKA|nr:hypothetical protein J8273_1379 [Carpediemonas membranifera]|eukprot:KAG9397028.1 hypothetical protein J8273_1379 [Carpediemonas membranifera]
MVLSFLIEHKNFELGLAIGISIGAIVVYIINILGLFFKVRISKHSFCEAALIGMDVMGPYSKVHKPMKEIRDRILCDEGLLDLRLRDRVGSSFGQYFDDPKSTPKDKCRAFVGVMLEAPDDTDIDRIRECGYIVKMTSGGRFPAIAMPSRSVPGLMIGLFRGYRLLQRLERTDPSAISNFYSGNSSLEIYDNENQVWYLTGNTIEQSPKSDESDEESMQ